MPPSAEDRWGPDADADEAEVPLDYASPPPPSSSHLATIDEEDHSPAPQPPPRDHDQNQDEAEDLAPPAPAPPPSASSSSNPAPPNRAFPPPLVLPTLTSLPPIRTRSPPLESLMYVCRLRLPDDFLVPLLRGALDHRRDQVRQNAGLAYLSYEYSDSAKKKKKDGEGGAYAELVGSAKGLHHAVRGIRLTLRADLDAGKVSEDKLDREFTWCATDEGDWLSLNMSFQRFDQTRENAVAQGKSEVFWEDRWKRQQRSLLASKEPPPPPPPPTTTTAAPTRTTSFGTSTNSTALGPRVPSSSTSVAPIPSPTTFAPPPPRRPRPHYPTPRGPKFAPNPPPPAPRNPASFVSPQKCNQHSESRPPVVPRIVPPGPVRPLPSVVNNPAPLFSRLHSSRFAYGNNSNLNQQQQQPNPFNSNFNNYRGSPPKPKPPSAPFSATESHHRQSDRPPSPSFAPTTPLKFRPLRFFDRVVAFPRSVVPAVIGQRGDVIHRISADSGAQCRVDKFVQGRPDIGLFCASGTMEEVEHAMRILEGIVRERGWERGNPDGWKEWRVGDTRWEEEEGDERSHSPDRDRDRDHHRRSPPRSHGDRRARSHSRGSASPPHHHRARSLSPRSPSPNSAPTQPSHYHSSSPPFRSPSRIQSSFSPSPRHEPSTTTASELLSLDRLVDEEEEGVGPNDEALDYGEEEELSGTKEEEEKGRGKKKRAWEMVEQKGEESVEEQDVEEGEVDSAPLGCLRTYFADEGEDLEALVRAFAKNGTRPRTLTVVERRPPAKKLRVSQ